MSKNKKILNSPQIKGVKNLGNHADIILECPLSQKKGHILVFLRKYQYLRPPNKKINLIPPSPKFDEHGAHSPQ